jgi:carboxypeptidase C (cathepsin A)
MTFRAFLLTCALAGAPLSVLAAEPAAPAPATAAAKPAVAVTRHVGKFNGQTVNYTASVFETFVAGPDGQPAGGMINTSYVRDGVKDPSKRPVMFVFNGGPGASSSPLHMGALGPRRILKGDTGVSLVDNPYSPLDAVDLVFIDPIGTGFSRPLPGVDGQPFWSVTGDAASVASVIEAWLKANGREASPHFLCGESYGTSRAGQIIATTAKDLPLDGVLLFSLVGGPQGPDLPYVMTLPTFAATAAYHGQVDAAGRTPQQIFDEAAAFARGDYISALIQGSSVSAQEKARVAAKLSALIGVPTELILAKNLRLDKYDFMLNLLKDKGLRTGQLDGRATGDLASYATRTPPYDDPSMSLGSSSADLLKTYLTGELKFQTAEAYKTLNLEINSKWKYNVERADAASQVGAAMRANPRLRLFWAGGLYDITTPLASGRYTLDHAGIPADRLTAVAFPTGHSIFETETALAGFTKAVRAFVSGG